MQETTANKVLGAERLKAYQRNNLGFEKAFRHYCWNIKISEAIYPVLAIFEVSLRNQVNESLKKGLRQDNWYNSLTGTGESRIREALNDLAKKRKLVITHSDIIASLTLGFWVSLFNKKLERTHWKHLRFAFPNMPINIRQRRFVERHLNDVRELRNRIFHHEPIFWNAQELERRYRELVEVIFWMDKEAHQLVVSISRFDTVLNEAKTDLGIQ